MSSSKQFLTGAAMAVLAGASAPAFAQDAGSAASLRASYEVLRSDLDHSPFGEPLHLASSEASGALKGDIHAVIDEPFRVVRAGLVDVRNWCDILVLHPNVTNCRLDTGTTRGNAHPSIIVSIGKHQTPVALSYRVAAAEPDYLNVRLEAADGPLGTKDYRIGLEAIPLDPQHAYVRLVFSHAYGVQARIAMRAYLSTFGRGKVGFTVTGRDANGQPVYVDDFRGALERNAMRYYLCVAAYLHSLSAPPQERFETRLRTFYGYSRKYSRQLHEDADYLDLKRKLAAAY